MKNFIKENWKILLPVLLVFCLTLVFYFKYKSLENDKDYWKTEAVKNKELVKVAEDMYETAAFEKEQLLIDNQKLNGFLKDSDKKASAYLQLSLDYKRQLGQIETSPVDTLRDTIYTAPDKRDRVFSVAYDELFLQGYFQPYSPFSLFITDLQLSLHPDIVISYDENDLPYAIVDTKSEYLKPSSFTVSVSPRPEKWEYFFGFGFTFLDNTGTGFYGVEIPGGIKKGSYSLYLTPSWHSDGKVNISAGLLKYFTF